MTAISPSDLQASIVEAARAVAAGRAEGQQVLDRLAADGYVEEVLRPATGLHQDGEVGAAAVLYRTFLAQGPHAAVAAVQRNLSIAALQLGDLPAARRHHIQAMASGHRDTGGDAAWADFLIQYGLHDAAGGELRTRLLTLPQSAPLRSLLFTLREFSDMVPGRHLEDHLDWWRGQPAVPPLSGVPQPRAGRRLRLGVIVRDLRSVSSFNRTFDIFPHLQGEALDVSLVSIRGGEGLRGSLADLQVHDLTADDPERFAAGLAALGFDMLLDLVSHGNSAVLSALRHRPAPVQMGWISNGITAGVPWIDYMLTDGLISPVGSERHYSETLVRLPAPAFAVPVLRQAPDLVDPPMLQSRHVTFGVFNRISKITSASVDAWAAIMKRVPHARLRIQNSNIAHAGMASRVRDEFVARGIPAERLTFGGFVPEEAYLADIGRTDIVLEPFPQTGGVTALDALWMGVPTVIHVVDDRPCCRAALLPASAAGIGSLVAGSVGDYVDTAVMLAGQPGFLRSLRFAMRERLSNAAFTRPEALADSLRRAMLAIWDQACSGSREAIWIPERAARARQ